STTNPRRSHPSPTRGPARWRYAGRCRGSPIAPCRPPSPRVCRDRIARRASAPRAHAGPTRPSRSTPPCPPATAHTTARRARGGARRFAPSVPRSTAGGRSQLGLQLLGMVEVRLHHRARRLEQLLELRILGVG